MPEPGDVVLVGSGSHAIIRDAKLLSGRMIYHLEVVEAAPADTLIVGQRYWFIRDYFHVLAKKEV